MIVALGGITNETDAQQRVRFPFPQSVNPGASSWAPSWQGPPPPAGVTQTQMPQVQLPQAQLPQVQLPQLPQGATASPWQPVPDGSGTISPTIPGQIIQTAPPIPGAAPSTATPWTVVPGNGEAVLGQQIQPFDPSFDPYNAPNPQIGIPAGQPIIPPAGTNLPAWPSGPQGPQTAPLGQGANSAPYLPPVGQGPGYVPPQTQNPYWEPVPVAPVFPQGFDWGSRFGTGTERLFQDTGALYTYLYGQDDDELQMHELELFTSLIWKNFFDSPHSLRLTPGFAFHFLDGPGVPSMAGPPPVGGKINLPGQLYSVYLNALWQPQLTPQFGADLNLRVGIYSDFDTITSNSLRFTGRALGVVQLTPNSSFKLGIEYFDRLDVKLLPAGGFFWAPDEQTRIDLYFPRPRISRYWTTWGNNELWWHIGGEYGGGSWTIDRIRAPAMGASDQIDINDIRVFAGIDWNRLDRIDGIIEVGYVFEREVVVRNHPLESLDLDDTFMIRLGVKF